MKSIPTRSLKDAICCTAMVAFVASVSGYDFHWWQILGSLGINALYFSVASSY
jgi:hypothetical protein